MFGFRNNTKADEVVELAKLYKKTKKYLTMEDVKELINIVYKGDHDYLNALTAMVNSSFAKKEESKEEKSN